MSADAPLPCVGSTEFTLLDNSHIIIQGDDLLPPRLVEYVIKTHRKIVSALHF